MGHAISSFVEAVFWIAVAGKDSYSMPAVLQAYGSINNEPFCSSYPQIGMEEQNCLLLFLFWHFGMLGTKIGYWSC